ncbi:MAG: signal peptidase I [Candidatus Bathyarchaeota archaeon]|nr:signal peptidase I [Candidatus Bathyarchaeota archaeon]
MAAATLKQLWKNEYFQTAIMIIAMIVIVFGFWYGSQLVLNTQYPALAVVSTSMLPTLNVGDVIIVQGVPAAQISANYTTGDIIVYRSSYDPEMRIVHRAVKKELIGNSYFFTTKGDNNPGSDSPFSESYLIGKVIARIPYVGNFALFINALGNFYYFIIIIIIVVNILLSLFFDTDEKKKSANEEPHEKRKLFGKLDIDIVFFLILNVLVIGFLVFSLFGVFTFWQPGAEMVDKHVTIRGMYSDLQYHASFKQSVIEVFLSQGFLTYQIDCSVNGAIRPGVPTFSWMQISIVFLLILDFWMANKYLHFAKRFKQALKLNSIYK